MLRQLPLLLCSVCSIQFVVAVVAFYFWHKHFLNFYLIQQTAAAAATITMAGQPCSSNTRGQPCNNNLPHFVRDSQDISTFSSSVEAIVVGFGFVFVFVFFSLAHFQHVSACFNVFQLVRHSTFHIVSTHLNSLLFFALPSLPLPATL